MATININRNVVDPFYRYKMPRIIAKVEGRGNGIKTVIVNMSDIAKSLHIPPSYPTKYLGIELGAQVIVDAKNDRYVVNGSHDCSKLQAVLYEFIERFVLCPACDNPETTISFCKQKDKLRLTCKACGSVSLLTRVHRLNAFVMKNLPQKEHKEEKNGKTHETHQVTTSEQDNTPLEGVETAAAETIWLTDTSREAVLQRMSALTQRAAELVINDDLDKPLEERLDIFKSFAKDKLFPVTADSYHLIEHEAKRLDLSVEVIFPICELIFTEQMTSKVVSHQKLFRILCSSPKGQRRLLYALEYILSIHPEWIKPDLFYTFEKLYDCDIVGEDVFLSWYEKKNSKYITDPALFDKFYRFINPFISWLINAEVETDSDVSGDLEPGHNSNGDRVSVQPIQTKQVAEDEDDLNIDDI